MTSIEFNEAVSGWALDDGDLLYILGLDGTGALQHRYVGLPLERTDEGSGPWWRIGPDWSYPFDDWWEAPPRWEYPARSAYVFGETTLAVSFGPNDRDCHLRYAEHDIDGHRLRVQLVDAYHPLAVDLFYELAPGTGVLRRWAEIRNDGASSIPLEQAGALAFFQPPATHTLHHLSGTGLNELNPVEEILAPGRKVLESRRGLTGHAHQPWFALAAQERDSIVFGALEWSGNWKLSFEMDIGGALSVAGGMSDFDFEHVLEPGATFVAPGAVVGVARGGLEEAARAMHRFIRGHVSPTRPSGDPLPVIFEGWNATWGRDVTAERLIQEAKVAADIGVEVFIVTAGWYAPVEGTYGFLSREGDWEPWPDAFPDGLEPVAEVVRDLGMRFGLWWEPEAVASDSRLFRDHPDWVFQMEPRGPQPTKAGQLVLNLGRPDVYEHVRNDVFRLIDRYGIAYFRTDTNQSLREVADPSGASGPGRDLAWRHVAGYYRLLDEVRSRYPDLVIEDCAGGGGRIDLGILRRTDTVWLSDNVNQLVRLGMFMSATSFLTPAVCEDWVVFSLEHSPDAPPFGRPEWPVPDDDFQFRVCMMGHLGIGADLHATSHEWNDRARQHIARYKELRPTIHGGDLFRLTAPPPRDGSGGWAALAIVAADRAEAVGFCYRLSSEERSFRFRVPDLTPEARYEVEIDGREGRRSVTGTELGDEGVDVEITDRHSSALLVARRTGT